MNLLTKYLVVLLTCLTIHCADKQYRHPLSYLTQEQQTTYKTLVSGQQTPTAILQTFLESCREQNEQQALQRKISFEKYLEQKNFEAEIQSAEDALRAQDAQAELEAQRKKTTQPPKKKNEMAVSNKPKKRSMSNPRLPSIPEENTEKPQTENSTVKRTNQSYYTYSDHSDDDVF